MFARCLLASLLAALLAPATSSARLAPLPAAPSAGPGWAEPTARPLAPAEKKRKRKKKSKERRSPDDVGGDRYDFEEQGLTFVFVGLDGLEQQKVRQGAAGGQLRARWTGELEERELEVELWVFEGENFQFDTPNDVLDLIERHQARNTKEGKPPFSFQEKFGLEGDYGFVSYAWAGIHTELDGTKPVGHQIVLGGVLKDAGYAIQIHSEPALLDEHIELVREFIEDGVFYDGDRQDPEWLEEEIDERWKRDAPDDLDESDLKVLKTDHYVIFTNSSGAKLFAKAMEENYDRIKEVYPFEDVAGQRLMPVFLFMRNDQYYDYCVKVLKWSESQAKKSKGVAFGDVYATWYEAPKDDVHIHEATHQIFKNRLGLNGGGSWFQEGVAEYMSSTKPERNIKSAVKRGRYTPFRELMERRSILMSAKTDKKSGSDASDNYTLAACIVEFVHNSKFGKKKFQEYIHAMGMVPRSDMDAIEAALRRVFGVGIDGFEEEFVKYWQKRR